MLLCVRRLKHNRCRHHRVAVGPHDDWQTMSICPILLPKLFWMHLHSQITQNLWNFISSIKYVNILCICSIYLWYANSSMFCWGHGESTFSTNPCWSTTARVSLPLACARTKCSIWDIGICHLGRQTAQNHVQKMSQVTHSLSRWSPHYQ